ncbi:MAG: radical SAM protein [Candidatus Shapirobacteria bacterium]
MKENQRFNYLDKLFQPSFRPLLRGYVENRLNSPQIVELDPTTRCNYGCPECISARVKGNVEILPTRLEQLINEFSTMGVRGIIFIGGGEPLMHSDMPNPIRQAYDLGIDVGLTTNGSLISKYLDTIANCVAWTRVSVDAGTSETYEKFRPSSIVNSFEKVIQNMEQLAKVKKGALGYCFLVIQRSGGDKTVTNASEIYQSAKIAKDIGCNYFEFKPMVNLKHYLLPFSAEMKEIIMEQFNLCKELESEKFAIVAPKSIGFLEENDNPVQPKKYEECAIMEFRTLITPTGIYPCPYMRGRTDKKMGSINDMPFDQFWNSSDRKNAMGLVNPKNDCGFYCIRHLPNVVLNHIKEMESEGVPILDYIREVDDIDDIFF